MNLKDKKRQKEYPTKVPVLHATLCNFHTCMSVFMSPICSIFSRLQHFTVLQISVRYHHFYFSSHPAFTLPALTYIKALNWFAINCVNGSWNMRLILKKHAVNRSFSHHWFVYFVCQTHPSAVVLCCCDCIPNTLSKTLHCFRISREFESWCKS